MPEHVVDQVGSGNLWTAHTCIGHWTLLLNDKEQSHIRLAKLPHNGVWINQSEQ